MANVTARKIETIGAELSAKLEEHNSLIFAEKLTEARPVYDAVVELVAEYNEASRLDTFGELRAIGDKTEIMKEACKRLEYPVLKLKEMKEDGVSLGIFSVEPATKAIDLLALHKYCQGIGANSLWAPHVERVNLMLTQRTGEEIGAHNVGDIASKFKMSKAAQSANDTGISKTDILKTLRMVVGEMIGEEYTGKITSIDVKYLLHVFGRKGKTPLYVKTATHKAMAGIMAELCHKTLLDLRYGVEFKGYNK